jgi:hypothetical protein
MKIGGHGLGDHMRLLAPVFGFIAAVWALRIVLDAAGAPAGVVRVFSVTVAGAAAVLMAALLIHVRHFGSYPNVVLAALLLECCAQLLIIAAIAFSTMTGIRTIFAAPEYSFSMSPSRHILGHLTFGVGIGTLFGAGMGCLFLWMLRKFVPWGPTR